MMNIDNEEKSLGITFIIFQEIPKNNVINKATT